MPHTFDWDDPEEIGLQLAEKHPGVDPLTIRFTDLHKWIIELPGFTGDPKPVSYTHLSLTSKKN